MFPSIVKAGVRQLLWCATYIYVRAQCAGHEQSRCTAKCFAAEALEDFDETFK